MHADQTTSIWVEAGSSMKAESRAHDDPVVILDGAHVGAAMTRLYESGQSVAFVERSGRYVGVVTIDDLRFAQEWAGPHAPVIRAMTVVVVEVSRDADVATAADAYCNGLRDCAASHASTYA